MATAIYRHQGFWVDYTPPSTAVNAGDVVVQNHIVGIASNDIAVGVQGALRIEGAFDFPLNAGDTPVFGTVMYWNASLLVATTNAAYATATLGFCINANPDGSGTLVRVVLTPSLEGAVAYG